MARTIEQIEALLLPYTNDTSPLTDWTWTPGGTVGGVTTPDRAAWATAPLGTMYLESWPDDNLIRVVSDEGGRHYDFQIDSVPGFLVGLLTP